MKSKNTLFLSPQSFYFFNYCICSPLKNKEKELTNCHGRECSSLLPLYLGPYKFIKIEKIDS